MTDAICLDAIEYSVQPHFWSRKRLLLNKVSMRVQPGELCAFLGGNGAGKTTTMRILLGLLRPTRGEGRLFGRALHDPRARLGLGYLPERANLPADLTPIEYVRVQARLAGIDANAADKASTHALARVGMQAHQHQRMRTFSKGMQQRVALAQAIVGEPRLLLLDEPLSGLDPPGRRDIRRCLQQERDRGAAIFFSTHILADVAALCDKAAVLVNGTLTHFATPAALLAQAEARRPPGAGANEIDVRCSGLSAAARAEATALCERAYARAGFDTFVGASTAQVNAIIDVVRAAGGLVQSVEPDAQSLENLLADSIAPLPQQARQT